MGGRSRSIAAVLGIATLALFAAAPSASADHHFISVSEVYPGTTGTTPDNEFIELQMYADGQNAFVGNGAGMEIYNDNGTGVPVIDGAFGTNPMFGLNQRTVLIATNTAALQFGVTPDYNLSPNSVNPAAGAVCFESTGFGGKIDCVSWGTFNNTTLGLPVGVNETGPIPNGSSITRSNAPGCPTLLEAGDDSNDSQTDFAPASPTPRPNTATPTETACGSATTPTTTTTPTAQETGKRAAALKKCKKKKTSRARKKCKKKANLLPV